MPAAVAFDVVSCPAKSVLRKIQQSWSRLNISSLPGSCQARTRSPMRFSPGSATRRSTCSFAKFQYSPIAVASSTCSSSEGTPQPIVASRAVPVLILSTSYSGTPMSAKAIFAGASQTRSVTTSASPRSMTRSIASSMSSRLRGSSAATRSGVKERRKTCR